LAIDRQALDRLRAVVGGGEEDLIEIISSFLEEAPQLMASLLQSTQVPDLATMRRAAHSIKSNARDMGATDLANICARIETLAAQGSSEAASEVGRADSALKDAVIELRVIAGLREGA
jgi:histidine phosphotransfer protein HptB